MHDAQRSTVQRRAGTIARTSFLKYFFLLPAGLWVVAFSIFPLFSALRYSLANYVLGRGITGYVGIDNYINVLRSGAFWYSLFITLFYVSVAVPLELVLGFLLAWFVNLSPPLLLRLVEALKTFGLPLALTGGGPGISTQLFSILNYFTTIQFFDFGKGSAMALLYLLFVSVVVALFFTWLRKRFD